MWWFFKRCFSPHLLLSYFFKFQVTLVTFLTYVFTSDTGYLSAQKAFTSLALFNILRFPINLLPMMISYVVQVNKRMQYEVLCGCQESLFVFYESNFFTSSTLIYPLIYMYLNPESLFRFLVKRNKILGIPIYIHSLNPDVQISYHNVSFKKDRWMD